MNYYDVPNPPREVLAVIDQRVLAMCQTLAVSLCCSPKTTGAARDIADKLLSIVSTAVANADTHSLGVIFTVNVNETTASVTLITAPFSQTITGIPDLITYLEGHLDTPAKQYAPHMN